MSISEVIENTTQAVETDPANAKALVRTTSHLVGPTEVALRSGRHRITVDEPASLGGQDNGASPVDHALIALASCQAITYRFWATKLGIELDDVEVSIEADIDLQGFFGLDDDVRAGFEDVRVQVTPKGPESPERYQELADAVDAHCPVLDLFANPTRVTATLAVPSHA